MYLTADITGLKLTNKDCPIFGKYYGHKIIIGIDADRSQHQEKMMQIAEFK